MKTAAGIIILVVIILMAVFLLWVTKGAGPPNPYPPVTPTSGLAGAIKNVQAYSASLMTALTSLTNSVASGPIAASSLANGNAMIPGAPALDISPVGAALASYNEALQGNGGAQAAVSSYNLAVQGLSAGSSISALLAADDHGSLGPIASMLQSGAQSMSESITNLTNTVMKNAALAKVSGATLDALNALASTSSSYAQRVLTMYGDVITAAKQTSAAAAALVQVVEGTKTLRRQAFMGYPHTPCQPVAPGGSACGPPFAVCMTEKCRTGYGCDPIGAVWRGVYENPIIASGAGLTIWP